MIALRRLLSGFSLVLAVAVLLSLVSVPRAAAQNATSSLAAAVERVGGSSRTQTAVRVAERAFPTADTVVLARADAYPDALAGAPLAAALGGPILLTGRDALDAEVAAEIHALGARTAILLGGPAALSDRVEQDLRAAGVTEVTRLAGADRFDTSRLVAQAVVERTGATEAYLTLGAADVPTAGWPDAVAVSALAARQGRPILLTTATEVPAPVRTLLDGGALQALTVVGGASAVAPAVADGLATAGLRVDRLAGENRYATSLAVAERTLADGATGSAWLVTGRDFPDALAAGPAAAATDGVLLLIDGTEWDAQPARPWLTERRADLPRTILVGGQAAIGQTVESSLGATPAPTGETPADVSPTPADDTPVDGTLPGVTSPDPTAPDAAEFTAEAVPVPTSSGVRLPVGTDFQRAVDSFPAGTRFIVARGTHRMQRVIPKPGMSFVGEAGAVVSGARLLPASSFKRDQAGRWYVTGQTQEGFTTGATLPGRTRDQHPEELFVHDGRRLRHVGSHGELRPGTWFFDYAADRIYVYDNPAYLGRTETSVTPFAFGGTGVRNVTLQNLIVEKYASPFQRGAVGGDVNNRFTYDWVVRNCTVRLNHAGGIQIGPGMLVEGSTVIDNGQIGLSGEGGHPATGYSARVVVRNTEIARNLALGFDWNHEGGGTKFSNTPGGMLFENNWVHHNAGPGAWWDESARHVEIRSNLVEENQEQGIFYEISWNGRIYWNTIRRNSLNSTGAPIDISLAHEVEVFENLLVDNKTGIYLRHDHKRIAQGYLANVRVHHNDVHSTGGWTGVLVDNHPNDEVFRSGIRFDANTYRTDSGSWLWNRQWGSYEQFRQFHPQEGPRLSGATRGALPAGATPYRPSTFGAR